MSFRHIGFTCGTHVVRSKMEIEDGLGSAVDSAVIDVESKVRELSTSSYMEGPADQGQMSHDVS